MRSFVMLGRKRRRLAGLMSLAVAMLLSLAASAGAVVFSNPTPIAIPAAGTTGVSNPYPSTIAVSGLSGPITNVSVTLANLTHSDPADIDALLVGPSGQNVVLMADASPASIINQTVTFDSAAPSLLPNPIVTGTFRPTNAGAFNGPAPAPAPPYGGTLTVFNGTVANGAWSLFVFDDAGGDTGTMVGGWSLNIIASGATIGGFAPTTGPAGTQVVISGTNLIGTSSVTFGGVPAAAFTVNSPGQITATVPPNAVSGPITVATPGGNASSATSFQVSPPPTIGAIAPPSGRVGDTVTIAGTDLTGASALRFGGTPAATFAVRSPISMTAVVPAGAGGGPLSVTTPGGTGMGTTPFIVVHPRSLTLTVAAKRVRGNLTANDSFAKCTAGASVTVQRRVKKRWRTVGTTTTGPNGAYRITSTRLPVAYRAFAALGNLPSSDSCLRANASGSGR